VPELEPEAARPCLRAEVAALRVEVESIRREMDHLRAQKLASIQREMITEIRNYELRKALERAAGEAAGWREMAERATGAAHWR